MRPATLASVAAVALAGTAAAGPACTPATMDGIKAKFYELPADVVKACDGMTPGFTLLDMVTKSGVYPTDAQVELFSNTVACKILLFDFQTMAGQAENCDYYPNEPLHKQASFATFKELVEYRRENDKKNAKTNAAAPSPSVTAAATTAAATVPPCSQEVLNSVKAKYYELPSDVTKACDAATPGFTLMDMFTTKGNYPTDQQIEIYTKAEACVVVYYDFKAILNTTEKCNYYPGELLQKQATFPSFKDLVAYHKAQDKGAKATTQSTIPPPQQTLPPCDVAQIDSVTSTIKSVPIYNNCTRAAGFDFDTIFRRTNVYPTLEQLKKFAEEPTCQALYADIQRILSTAPMCLFYDKTHVSFPELSKFPTLDTLVSFQQQQEGHVQTLTPAAAGTTLSPPQHIVSSSAEGSSGQSSMSSILVIAGIFAAVGVIGAAIMYIRRKAKTMTTEEDAGGATSANQSIFVVNANSAL